MLNLIYAMKIFGHRSIELFRRELSRNSQLKIVCGLSDGEYKYMRKRRKIQIRKNALHNLDFLLEIWYNLKIA